MLPVLLYRVKSCSSRKDENRMQSAKMKIIRVIVRKTIRDNVRRENRRGSRSKKDLT